MLTQKLGVLLGPSDATHTKRLAEQIQLIESLLDILPDDAYGGQCFHENFDNWLPFLWRGYQQTTRYTYVYEDLSNLDALWDSLAKNLRTKKEGIEVKETDDLEYFFRINKMSFERQQLEVPHSFELVAAIENAARINGGTATLHSAYFAVGVKPGMEVIVPTYTFFASAAPFSNAVPSRCSAMLTPRH